MELMPFESHSIEFPDGTRTMPGEPLLRDSALARASLRSLATFCPIEDPANPPRVIDLGCREGGFALEFAKAGYEVLGLEARESNVARCRLVQEAHDLPNLSFVVDDARFVGSYGRFDAAFCCGLLYHLDRPVEHVMALGAITDRLLILNTHYADFPPSPYFALSEMTEHEGVLGKWYVDLPPGVSLEEMEASRGASWGNEHSFWVERRHLLETIRRAGFDMVLEQHDFLDDIPQEAPSWWDEQQRSQFLGVRTAAVVAAV